MKVSEAIGRLEVGDTVWVKGKVLDFDRGGYDHCPLEVSLFYEDEWIHENDEISLTDDQQVVLDYLIKQAERCSDIGYLVGDLNFFASTEDGKAWTGLTEKERYQVLAAFAEWGLSQLGGYHD